MPILLSPRPASCSAVGRPTDLAHGWHRWSGAGDEHGRHLKAYRPRLLSLIATMKRVGCSNGRSAGLPRGSMPRPLHRAPQNRGRTLDGGRNARERRPENIFVFDLWSEEVQARVRRDLHAPVTIAASPSLGDVLARF